MKLKFWERKTKKGRVKYEVEIPASSNGWADVIGNDGTLMCTAYVDGKKKATLIAAALNAYQRRHP